jgi:hypothetical protein
MNALAELPTDDPGEVPRDLRHGPAPTDLGACLSLKHNCLADPKGYGHPKPPGDQELDVRNVVGPTGFSAKLVVAGCFRVIGCERYG